MLSNQAFGVCWLSRGGSSAHGTGGGGSSGRESPIRLLLRRGRKEKLPEGGTASEESVFFSPHVHVFPCLFFPTKTAFPCRAEPSELLKKRRRKEKGKRAKKEGPPSLPLFDRAMRMRRNALGSQRGVEANGVFLAKRQISIFTLNLL